MTTNRHIIQHGLALFKNNNSPVWRASLKVGDQLIRKTTGEKDFELAKKKAVKMHFDLTYVHEKVGTLEAKTFDDAYAEAFAKLVKDTTNGLYVNTRVPTIDYMVKKHILPYFKDRMVVDVDTKMINDWFEWRDENCGKLAGASIRDLYGHIRFVLNWCIAEGFYNKVDLLNIKWPKTDSTQVKRAYYKIEDQKKLIFSLEQYKQRTNKTHERMYREDLQDFVMLMLASGCRPSEMLRVGLQNFKEIAVGKSKTYQLEVVHGTKGHPRGNVILLPFAYHLIKSRIARYEKRDVDLTKDFWPNHKDFKNIFKRFNKWCGLDRDDRGEQYCAYSLRHTYATNMLKQGHVSMHQLAKQMGTSVAMLEKHYSHVVPSLVAEKFTNLEDAEKIMLPHSTMLHEHFTIEQ